MRFLISTQTVGEGSDFSEQLGSTFFAPSPRTRGIRNNSEREVSYDSYHPGGLNAALGDGSVRVYFEHDQFGHLACRRVATGK